MPVLRRMATKNNVFLLATCQALFCLGSALHVMIVIVFAATPWFRMLRRREAVIAR